MARFVLLDHDHPVPHFDLMLEVDGALWTWRLRQEPCCGEAQTAERLADHRLAYLEYQGPISGGRGSVSRRDRGEAVWVERGPARCTLHLNGQRVRGRLILTWQTGDLWEVRLEAER
jgi:hypothetical protein